MTCLLLYQVISRPTGGFPLARTRWQFCAGRSESGWMEVNDTRCQAQLNKRSMFDIPSYARDSS
jgi:hypothetical protein